MIFQWLLVMIVEFKWIWAAHFCFYFTSQASQHVNLTGSFNWSKPSRDSNTAIGSSEGTTTVVIVNQALFSSDLKQGIRMNQTCLEDWQTQTVPKPKLDEKCEGHHIKTRSDCSHPFKIRGFNAKRRFVWNRVTPKIQWLIITFPIKTIVGFAYRIISTTVDYNIRLLCQYVHGDSNQHPWRLEWSCGICGGIRGISQVARPHFTSVAAENHWLRREAEEKNVAFSWWAHEAKGIVGFQCFVYGRLWDL